MNTQLKEKMQQAADDYLDESGLVINYEEDNYAAGAYDGFIAGATAMYSELAPLVEWVSVDDRLPEEWERVLIKYKSGFIDIVDEWENRFVKDYGITHWRRIEL